MESNLFNSILLNLDSRTAEQIDKVIDFAATHLDSFDPESLITFSKRILEGEGLRAKAGSQMDSLVKYLVSVSFDFRAYILEFMMKNPSILMHLQKTFSYLALNSPEAQQGIYANLLKECPYWKVKVTFYDTLFKLLQEHPPSL